MGKSSCLSLQERSRLTETMLSLISTACKSRHLYSQHLLSFHVLTLSPSFSPLVLDSASEISVLLDHTLSLSLCSNKPDPKHSVCSSVAFQGTADSPLESIATLSVQTQSFTLLRRILIPLGEPSGKLVNVSTELTCSSNDR